MIKIMMGVSWYISILLVELYPKEKEEQLLSIIMT